VPGADGGDAVIGEELLARPFAHRGLHDATVPESYRGPIGVVGFDPWMLAGVRASAPRVARGQNVGLDPRLSLSISAAHFASYDVGRLMHTTLERVRSRMPVLAWTVRTEEMYRIARSLTDGPIIEGAAVELAAAGA
jgi:hypothetical protein